MELQHLRHGPLNIPHWQLTEGQVWCLWGANGSGKSLLCRLLARQLAPHQGEVRPHAQRVELVSLEAQQQLYEDELRRDDSDFLDGIDEGRTVRVLLEATGADPQQLAHLAAHLNLTHLLDRGFRRLSSGEARAVLIARSASLQPDLLILDEPMEGLDAQARVRLTRLCADLIATGQRLLLAINRYSDLADFVTHIALLQRGTLVVSGPKPEVLARPEVQQLVHWQTRTPPTLPSAPASSQSVAGPLVIMKQVSVHYGDSCQFDGLTWTLHRGQHTLITGPNGSGKSTLLQLITGDHPQCYSNDLTVFGYRRGSGESIWQLKQHLGLISSALHRDYRVGTDALATVVSGLYDTIGIYQQVSAQDRSLGMAWLELLGLESQASTPLKQLPYGHQRLLLIARALIKQPPLLILDEPTQGLDDLNRHLVLAFLEQLADLDHTTLLMVSHRDDEHLSLFQHRINFEPAQSEQACFRVSVSAQGLAAS